MPASKCTGVSIQITLEVTKQVHGKMGAAGLRKRVSIQITLEVTKQACRFCGALHAGLVSIQITLEVTKQESRDKQKVRPPDEFQSKLLWKSLSKHA